MKIKYSLFSTLLILSMTAIAQDKGNIRGLLIDTVSKQPIADATITVMYAKDSSLVTFSRSGKTGEFQVNYLDKGNYRILITHVGYRNFARQFEINDNNKSVDLGYIPMNNKSTMLDEVTVSQEKAPVTLKNDTIEYNAGSFKTKPNAVVEDLLKKLPGVQVDKDGKIKANGEEVKKVLVDGKQFFGNDPKLATKNLPADIVDKVQVFDKKSDQAQFTGFDDGNSEKTINLSLKPDKKHGSFGKLAAGAGTKETYQGNFSLNRFNGERQISALGMANNTNKQGFSFMDILNFSGGLGSPGGGGGRSGQMEISTGGLPMQGFGGGNTGITTTWAGGLNFNDTWDKKLEINGSYFYNRIEDRVEQKSSRQYILPGNNFNRYQDLLSNRRNENHRINFMADYKLDSMNSIRLTSTANLQQGISESRAEFLSETTEGVKMNDGFSGTASNSDGYSWNNSLLWRHKFAKKGRTFSASISYNMNDGLNESRNNSVTNFYYPNGNFNQADTIDQLNDQDSKNQSHGAVLSYTEPLSRRSLLEFNFNNNISNAKSGRKTFDLDDQSGKYTDKNELLSNRFDNTYRLSRAGLAWRYQQKTYNFAIGSAIQQSDLETDFHFMTRDSSLRKSFLNFLPNARLEYNINKYRTLRFNYNTNTRQPSASQLNPIIDLSDPLNIRVGNPNLSQEYTNRFQLNYVSFDPFQKKSFFSMLNFSSTNNKIVSFDVVDAQGIRTTSYTNTDGVYTLNGTLSWGLPVKPIKSTLNLNTNFSRGRNINYINTEKNIINSWNVVEEINLNFSHKELLDFTLGANVGYNGVRYSLPVQENTNYWNQEYSLDANIYLPLGFSLASEFSFIRNTGYSDGYNNNISLWNAGLAKQLFKNKKGEIKVQVFDILNQNKSITRNANQNYVEDLETRVLNRYLMVSFTYNISHFAGKAVPMQRQGNFKIIGEKVRM